MNFSNTQSGSKLDRIGKNKHVVCTLTIELLSFYAINVRENQVNSILRKIIKRITLRNNISKQGVVVFNMRLLPRTVRITEENRGFLCSI